MLTYIVEDDPLKSSRLGSFISERFPKLHVLLLGSFQSALRAIDHSVPSLIILDMTIPTFERTPGAREGRLRPLGGYDLMRKIRKRKLTPKVIVVTQLETFGEGEHQVSFAEITERCKREFPDMFVGSVYYHPQSSEWVDPLTELLRTVIATAGAPC